MTWRAYHESTKHSAESLRRTPHVLDWNNMPDPFRHYEGVPILDLPADPPPPETPMIEALEGVSGATSEVNGSAFLSQLLFHCAAISAAKRVPATGYRYALRVNPSSGNLHPTEFHFVTRGLREWPDGLYHYRPSEHTAEQRARGELPMKLPGSSAPIVFILTSISWREAWKYGNRAYRYCLHDIGHAWQALALAALAIGCESFATGLFPDDELAQFCRLHDDELPMLIVELRGASIPTRGPDACENVWYGGYANQISAQRTAYPQIDGIHAATKARAYGTGEGRDCQHVTGVELAPTHPGEIRLPSPASSPASPGRTFGEVVRMRRSALDFVGGLRSISLVELSTILAATSRPLSADFAGARYIQLYLYVHRVHGLQPGVYRFWRESGALEQIRSGDQRVAAAGLSLGQDLAGNACVAFSMIADLERACRIHGDRGYRYAHFEAGAIGHRLYLIAETLGLAGTGIGAFYDDEVNRYLNLTPAQGQAVYHFAIGYPIPDPRLQA